MAAPSIFSFRFALLLGALAGVLVSSAAMAQAWPARPVRVVIPFPTGNAADITARTGLVADSWMTLNAQLMVALQSQGSSSNMIQFFVIIAVALGISSVLVVSITQKGKEIGILRAMGASSSQMQRVFLWQGAIVGLAGSVLGSLFGYGLLLLFRLAPLTFTIGTPPSLFLRACAIAMATGLLAAVLPARRAANLDPAIAIRMG